MAPQSRSQIAIGLTRWNHIRLATQSVSAGDVDPSDSICPRKRSGAGASRGLQNRSLAPDRFEGWVRFPCASAILAESAWSSVVALPTAALWNDSHHQSSRKGPASGVTLPTAALWNDSHHQSSRKGPASGGHAAYGSALERFPPPIPAESAWSSVVALPTAALWNDSHHQYRRRAHGHRWSRCLRQRSGTIPTTNPRGKRLGIGGRQNCD